MMACSSSRGVGAFRENFAWPSSQSHLSYSKLALSRSCRYPPPWATTRSLVKSKKRSHSTDPVASCRLGLLPPSMEELSRILPTTLSISSPSTTYYYWQAPLTNSLLAGLSTCLGAAVVFLPSKNHNHNTNHKANPQQDQLLVTGDSDSYLAFALALAASVMMTVSLTSILPESFANVPLWSKIFWEGCLSLTLGCATYMAIEKLLPDPPALAATTAAAPVETTSNTTIDDKARYQPPYCSIHGGGATSAAAAATPKSLLLQSPASSSESSASSESLNSESWNGFLSGADLTNADYIREWRLTLLLFLTLLLHNIPEGMAVAASSMDSTQLGWTTALAIGCHNIPEGVAISVPCLAARPNAPFLAFGLASLSGLAEPFGAIVALFLMNPQHLHVLDIHNALAFVGGIMTTVAVLELGPEAINHSQKSGQMPLVLGGVTGIIVMTATEMALSS